MGLRAILYNGPLRTVVHGLGTLQRDKNPEGVYSIPRQAGFEGSSITGTPESVMLKTVPYSKMIARETHNSESLIR